jgi:hypothetical protein
MAGWMARGETHGEFELDCAMANEMGKLVIILRLKTIRMALSSRG